MGGKKFTLFVSRVIKVPLQAEFLSKFSTILRSTILSSTAKTWGGFGFDDDDDDDEATPQASITTHSHTLLCVDAQKLSRSRKQKHFLCNKIETKQTHRKFVKMVFKK